MAEVGLSVLGKIAELLMEPIQRELGYLFCFNNNFQELQTQLEKLIAMKNDVQAREDAEIRKRNTLGESVKLWIVNADGIVVETESLLNEKAEVQKGCFSIKWCPNIILRFSLGRKGKKLSLVLIELLQSGGELPHTGHVLTMPPINMRDYNGDACDFDSRSQIVEDIIEKLRNEKTMLIGICGMGGIGKTTLAKQALQKVQDFHKPLFTIQVITTVSSSPNFNTIQQEVEEMLGFSLKDVDSLTINKSKSVAFYGGVKDEKKYDIFNIIGITEGSFPVSEETSSCRKHRAYQNRSHGHNWIPSAVDGHFEEGNEGVKHANEEIHLGQ
ncbi:disease resistance protein At4g27190-like [Impatiens glandulifera]|uniref:disease resistance protein At4g27190-like n=1 Tax=Impatiens glandulifera TaxID=253017 RepID=UPI001FB16F14|nr:disease resistance protein At4g27190-like [Impatiens glandulifera]